MKIKAESRSGTGKVHEEPRISCGTRKKEKRKRIMRTIS